MPPSLQRLTTILGFTVATMTLSLVTAAAPASATMPGENGRIAFNRNGDIYSMAADGTGLKRLTSYGGGASTPKWSRDGKKIAYVRGGYIWTMNADGSGKTRRWLGAAPSWSPDGTRIAFVATETDADAGESCTWKLLGVHSLSGGSLQRIETYNESGCYNGWAHEDYGPTTSWATNGAGVYFTYFHKNPQESDVESAGVAYADIRGVGSAPTLIADYNGGSYRYSAPTVDSAPNRPNIAFSTDAPYRDAKQRIYVWSLDGTYRKQVTAEVGTSFPAYSPDGKYLLYTQHTAGHPWLIRRIVLGSPTAPVTVLGNASQPDWQAVK